MREHPDLQKLPLEIDGIPVRETIREIFRNPENGTPDNISKAGCLALALKSNEVGGHEKGYLVWNAWRWAFPIRRKDMHPIIPDMWINYADFRNGNFSERDINFSFFEFGHGADFSKCSWERYADFFQAKFGDECKFIKAILGVRADFRLAQFGDFCDFSELECGHDALFEAAIFGRSANFSKGKWNERIYFSGANFDDGLKFDGTTWGGFVSFLGDFVDGLNNRLMTPEKDERTDLVLKTKIGKNFGKVSFENCEFQGLADFENRQFTGSTSFAGTKFLITPRFYGCELHENTSFEGTFFPQPTGSEESARVYRTLKLAFSKQQAIREEQRFFKLEMEEETLRETGINRWLFGAYKLFSDYGFSVTRPLLYGSVAVVALSLVYGLLSWLGQCGLSVGACHFAPQWLEFSLLQTLPLPGLDKLSEAASKAFWPQGAWWSFGLSALVILHKTLSLAVLFLIGLALRNLFKLK